MTLASTVNRNSYVGVGSVGPYTYNFRIFAETDLRVTVRDAATDEETTLAYPTDYSVTGVGDDDGTITLTDALAVDDVLTIRRVLPITQLTQLRNQRIFYPETHEDEYDRIVMILQQLQDELDRCYRVGETIDPGTVTLQVPPVPSATRQTIDGFYQNDLGTVPSDLFTAGFHESANPDSFTVTVPDGSNRLFFVAYALDYGGSITDFEPTLNGQALTLVGVLYLGSSDFLRIQMYQLLEEDLPAAGDYTLVANLTGPALSFLQCSGIFAVNASQDYVADPLDGDYATSVLNGNDRIGHGSADVSGTTLTIPGTGTLSVVDGGAGWAVVADNTGGSSFTESGSWGEDAGFDEDLGGGVGNVVNAHVVYSADGTDTVTFTRAAAAARMVGMAVAIRPASGSSGQAATPMTRLSGPNDNATAWIAPADGWFLNLTLHSNDARSAGTATVEIYVNNVATGVQAILNATDTTFAATAVEAGTITFSAGDLVTLKLSSDAAWAPTGADLRASFDAVLG